MLRVRAQPGNNGQSRGDPCGTAEIRCTGRWTMAYPENCTQYIICTGRADKSLILEDCPAGEFFDNVSLTCLNENYQCQSPCPGGAYSSALASSASSRTPLTLSTTNPPIIRSYASTVAQTKNPPIIRSTSTVAQKTHSSAASSWQTTSSTRQTSRSSVINAEGRSTSTRPFQTNTQQTARSSLAAAATRTTSLSALNQLSTSVAPSAFPWRHSMTSSQVTTVSHGATTSSDHVTTLTQAVAKEKATTSQVAMVTPLSTSGDSVTSNVIVATTESRDDVMTGTLT